MEVSGVGVRDYMALKQVALENQVNIRLLKKTDDIVKQQAQQLLDIITNSNVGRNINVRA